MGARSVRCSDPDPRRSIVASLNPGTSRLASPRGSAAYIAVWASPISSFQLRFLVPVVPFLAVLGAHGAMRIREAADATLKHGGIAAGAVIVMLSW